MKLSLSCSRVAALLGILSGMAMHAAAALPDLRNAAHPQPLPTAPAGWESFQPPVGSDLPPSGVPAMAEWTRTGGPDDTLILTGDNLSQFSGNDEGRDTEFLFFGQTASTGAVQSPGSIQRLDGMKAAVTLPTDLPPWSTYFLWPRNSSGYGYPVAINRTDAWWLSQDGGISRGDTVSVFGRNLAHDGGTTISWVYLKPAGTASAGTWATVTSVNPYRIQFQIPNTLVNGAYEVWVHNGHGGDYGWSGPLALTIGDRYVWNGATFNVKDYGAIGDGVTDDTQAIRAALTAAIAYRDQSGTLPSLHPTLYFPAGTYLMNHGISLGHDIRFTGAGKTSTILRCSADFHHVSTEGLLYAAHNDEHDIEVSNLTLDANGHFAETSFPYDYLVCCTFVQQWQDIRFVNVRIQSSNPGCRTSAISFGAVNRLTLSGCDLVGGNLMMMNTTHVTIDRCSFSFSNDLFTGIYGQAVNGVSITGCECADNNILDAQGQGLGRFVILGGYLGSQKNIYIGDNKTVDCAPRAGAQDQNTGEQILSEGNVVRYEGHPASASSGSVTFSDLAPDPNPHPSLTAVIVAGKGLGQTRPITAINLTTKSITVSPAWNVIPDSSSVVQIAWTTDRCVIYHNTFDGKNDYATRVTASCAIEPYGGCNEWIADSNTITNVRYAIYVAGLAQYSPEPATSTEPCLFHFYANNVIHDCHRGSFNFADTPMDSQSVPLDPQARVGYLGHVFRSNRWSNLVSCGICFDGATAGVPVDMAVFEHNTFGNLPHGIDFFSNGHYAQAANTVLYRNTFIRGTAASANSFGANFISSTISPVLADNVWSGFENEYTGTAVKGIPNLPIRTFDLQASTGVVAAATSFSIVNTGTVPLAWTATADSTWVTLSPASGTLPDENSTATVNISCDTRNLLSGTYHAVITASASGSLRKMSVTLTVGSSAAKPDNVTITIKVVAP